MTTRRKTRLAWTHGPLLLEPKAWGSEVEEREPAERPYTEECGAAIVEICGALLHRKHGFLSYFFDDYESICSRVGAALACPTAQRVILRIDSPGGDANGCFELARELRTMARAAEKPLLAFSDGMAASAAYAIACAADEVYVSQTSYLGSIGVLQPMVDVTAANRAMGLNVVVVTSGVAKTDGNPDVAITDEAIARVQSQVDGLAALFFALVAEMRGVSADAVRKLEGALLYGERAISAGLGDRVSTWRAVLTGISSTSEADAMPVASKGYEEAISSLRKAAEKDDDEGKRAKRMLRAELEDDEPKKDEPAKQTKAEEPPKEEPKKDDAAAAKALTAGDVRSIVADALSVHAKAEADRAEVSRLLATRNDFDPAMRATLERLPVAEVRSAVETWPRRTGALAPAAASQALPTVQGEGAGALSPTLPPEVDALLNRRMGGANTAKAFTSKVEIGMGDRTAARARVAELEGK